MYKYNPTLNANEAAANIRQYVKDHQDAFWQIIKPLIPVFIATILLDAYIQAAFLSKIASSPFGALISGYFYAVIVISWHRLVIHGPEKFVPMRALKPKRSELKFIFVGIGLYLTAFAAFIIVGIAPVAIHPALLIVTLLPIIIIILILSFRLSFYFPALATDNPITLKQSYYMSKGYIKKLLICGIMASWRVILVMFGYGILMGIISVFFSENPYLFNGVVAVLIIPYVVYFEPLLTVIGVSVLSNYYQHALQYGNRGGA